ncbi:MAG: D-hexose-6-phosphate mutarotase [Rubritalea sp.]|uniref:D-hexose-6-phosphate mutarotase n=1 Tax=Rubritalea sp. TaxID=2109375 RepID=UPI0032420171
MAPTLSKKHLIPFELWYEDFAPGYPTIRISNAHASATIALHGAHVIDWIPRDQEPVIFTSREAIFTEGKAIRGGIPICWPWFGAHPNDQSMPAHGVARNRFWQLASSHSTEEFTEVTLQLNTQTIDICQDDTSVSLTIRVGQSLSLALKTTNNGNTPVTIGGALHSYFYVSDIGKTTLSGLENSTYLDALDGTTKLQEGSIHFKSEVDTVYLQTDKTVVIHDPGFKRDITVEKTGSLSTVVWNPWTEKSKSLADLADDEFHDFVCVETSNALEDVYNLAPGAEHSLTATISAIPTST